jgi:hypothetical protein
MGADSSANSKIATEVSLQVCPKKIHENIEALFMEIQSHAFN